MAEATPVVGIIMGSESDMPAMEPCMAQLDAMGVPYEVKVASAHRKPAVVHEWAETAHDRGIKVIIAANAAGHFRRVRHREGHRHQGIDGA